MFGSLARRWRWRLLMVLAFLFVSIYHSNFFRALFHYVRWLCNNVFVSICISDLRSHTCFLQSCLSDSATFGSVSHILSPMGIHSCHILSSFLSYYPWLPIFMSLSVSLFISLSLSKSPILISLSFCSNISFLLTLSTSDPVSFFQSLSATFRRKRKLSFLSKTIGGNFISRARAQAEPSTG